MKIRSAALGALAACLAFAATAQQLPLHEKMRSLPYPRAEHTLYLNPAPLVVPDAMKTGACLQFALSDDAAFPEGRTQLSDNVPWRMFSPHRALKPGTWYWRFRNVDAQGKPGAWSRGEQFTVGADTPVFVAPQFEKLVAGIPAGHPRMFCFLDAGIERNRGKIPAWSEYKEMLSRARGGLNLQQSTAGEIYGAISNIQAGVINLHTAYLGTGDEVYAEKMLSFVRPLLGTEMPKKVLGNDFAVGHTLIVLGYTYDACYALMDDQERKACEEMILKICRVNYKHHIGYEENHIFDNHFWQHMERTMFQMCMLLHEKYPEAREMLRYYYELWCARAPATGFNRDGNWINGAGYFNANIYTLYYMPSMLSHLTGVDFLQHPWYRNAGQAMLYAWPAGGQSAGFGDGAERGKPGRQRAAMADFLARETGSPYAAWYAAQLNRTGGGEAVTSDYEMRLYRMANIDKPLPQGKLPADSPKALWFKDCGEFVAHSDLADRDRNMFLSFRSSPFGSGSHTLSDQNSFNLQYGGKPVYYTTGYYLHFSDPHNLLSYRHTRAHNTILVNGMGQPFTSVAYGDIVRAADGEHISYCLGDASKAYCGLTDDPMWQRNFKDSNVEESAANGFGPTPLTLYRRHVLVLHPDKVVIYDELEASEPATWQWLLHSPSQFTIDPAQRTLTSSGQGFSAVAQLFSAQDCTMTQTDQYFEAPDMAKNKRNLPLPAAWHMTADFPASKANRILTVIRVTPAGAKAVELIKKGDQFTCGDWVISAQLDPAKPAALSVSSTSAKASFSYGNDNPKIDGKAYKRATPGSTVLRDVIDGKARTVEMTDRAPMPTR